MRIVVKLVGGLVHTIGFSEQEMEVPEGATAGALLDLLGIADPRSVIVSRNGWGIAPDEEVREGDRIAVSPPFSGG